MDQFAYLGSNISSTKCDVTIHITKAWNVIYKKIKRDFFHALVMSIILHGCALSIEKIRIEKKLVGILGIDGERERERESRERERERETVQTESVIPNSQRYVMTKVIFKYDEVVCFNLFVVYHES